jgi:hypothetical protein
MRRATAFLLALSIAALALVPAHAQGPGQQVRIINGIGLVDYYKKPTFKPGDWVRYHMVGSSALGSKDDYIITLTIAGEEEFWGEDCFWVETISLKDGVEVASVASLMSYSVFKDPEAVTKMKNYVRKQINSMTESGEPVQEIVRRPSSGMRTRESLQSKLEYYIDSLGTAEVEIPKGKFTCDKILFKQAAGASLDFADSSRYEEVRENRTIFRTTQIPISSIALEEIENIVSRKTWVRGKSTDAPEVFRDRALGRAIAIEWGTGRKSLIVDEALQKPLSEQRAEARRKSGKPRSG